MYTDIHTYVPLFVGRQTGSKRSPCRDACYGRKSFHRAGCKTQPSFVKVLPPLGRHSTWMAGSRKAELHFEKRGNGQCYQHEVRPPRVQYAAELRHRLDGNKRKEFCATHAKQDTLYHPKIIFSTNCQRFLSCSGTISWLSHFFYCKTCLDARVLFL